MSSIEDLMSRLSIDDIDRLNSLPLSLFHDIILTLDPNSLLSYCIALGAHNPRCKDIWKYKLDRDMEIHITTKPTPYYPPSSYLNWNADSGYHIYHQFIDDIQNGSHPWLSDNGFDYPITYIES